MYIGVYGTRLCPYVGRGWLVREIHATIPQYIGK